MLYDTILYTIYYVLYTTYDILYTVLYYTILYYSRLGPRGAPGGQSPAGFTNH